MTLLQINWGMWIPIAMMFLLIFGWGGFSATRRGDKTADHAAEREADRDAQARPGSRVDDAR